MTVKSDHDRGIRFLVIAAALVIIIGGINQAQSVLVSFLVAFFLAMLGTPPVLWLERKRIPSVVAVLLVVAGMVTILLIVGAIVGASINSFYIELPVYQTRLPLGPVGMVLCIPLTMTLKFACENNKGTRWIAVLLGPEAPPESIPPALGENVTK
jgi:predicted PurR-regulated permease PerM